VTRESAPDLENWVASLETGVLEQSEM
jgi:hypothetical protein